MKIFYTDRKHGIVKLKVENLDDLWYLSSVLQRGDLVKTKTDRRIKAKEDMAREKSSRVTVTIGIRLEKVEFSSISDTLRITGVIEEGPEDLVPMGSHHTFNVTEGTTLKIQKESWSRLDLERLRDAEKASVRPKLLIAIIDDGDANFGLVRESKIEHYDLSEVIGGKYETKGREKRKEEFYQHTAKFILDTDAREKISAIIIAGAGFEPENFFRFMQGKHPELKDKLFLEHIGSHGRNGINEVMKRDAVKKISKGINSARDIRLMDRLLEGIGRDTGLAVYGIDLVEQATNLGAIEVLLVCDNLFLEKRALIENMIKAVNSTNGKFHLLNHEEEAGKQLTSLGGIAAILRFKVQ